MLRERCQGKACLSLCSLSPGAPRGVPGEGLSVSVQSVSWCSERGAMQGLEGTGRQGVVPMRSNIQLLFLSYIIITNHTDLEV